MSIAKLPILERISQFSSLDAAAGTALSSDKSLRSFQENHCKTCCILTLRVRGRVRGTHSNNEAVAAWTTKSYHSSTQVDLGGADVTSRPSCPAYCIKHAYDELQAMIFDQLGRIANSKHGQWSMVEITNIPIPEEEYESKINGTLPPQKHPRAPHFDLTWLREGETHRTESYGFRALLRWLLRVGYVKVGLRLEREEPKRNIPHSLPAADVWKEATLHLELKKTPFCKSSTHSPPSRRAHRQKETSISPVRQKTRRTDSKSIADLTHSFERMSLQD